MGALTDGGAERAAPVGAGLVPAAAGSARRVRVRAVHLFVACCLVVGTAALVVAVAGAGPHIPWSSRAMYPCYLLAVMLAVGELRPIPVPRGDDSTDQITVSSTFATALLLIGPLPLALAVQSAAVAVDDLRHRRPPRVLLLNVSQYLVTLTSARVVFSLLSGEPVLAATTELRPSEIVAALGAGVTYFVVNNTLVATAVALDTGTSPLAVLRDDVRFQLATSSILLGLAPVAAHASLFSIVMLPLLLLPILGVQRNAQMALDRQQEALHDSLTGLPNRELLRRRAARALAALGAQQTRIAVLLLDLDHFKEINDTLGHPVGDEVIREISRRMSASTSAGDVVARLGGDEFAVVLTAVSSADEARSRAAVIGEALRAPMVVEGVRLGVQASIGIALAPDHAGSVETLLKRADIALYRAKSNRGDIVIYRPDIDQHTLERLSLLSDLHSAVDNGEFMLVFQPQVCSSTGEVLGVEALSRWLHPRHGLVGPDEFIALAENTGAIAPLSRWVIEQAVSALRRWRDRGHDISVSVNVSARLLTDLNLPGFVGEVLDRHGVPASRLTVEVTESTIMADPKRALLVLGQLRDMGVGLAVDDFGTGYSSLSYLRRMEVDELKIDKSFVLQMGRDDNSAIIVRSTVELGHSLGLSVTAEGVEDKKTLDSLVGLGCDRIQGFYLSRPLPAPALEAWLDVRQHRRRDLLVPSLQGVVSLGRAPGGQDAAGGDGKPAVA